MGNEKQIEMLKDQIKTRLKSLQTGSFTPKAEAAAGGSKHLCANFSERRELRGHFQKVYTVHWAGQNSDLLLSASQDGKLLVWNAETTNKINAINLEDSWVMTCAFEQTNNHLLASGGLKCVSHIYENNPYEAGVKTKPKLTLEGHEGYISCTRFVSETSLITASGDKTCRLWDVTKGVCSDLFKGHTQDVMSVSTSPNDANLFITGSIDLDAKLWDLRVKGDVGVFKHRKATNVFSWEDEPEFTGELLSAKSHYTGHESDINSVTFFPDGNAFASGSDDSTCRIWDLRSHQEVNQFLNKEIIIGVNSVEFSKSGRVLFAGYDDCNLLAWDTLHVSNDPSTLPAVGARTHTDKVASVSVHTAGKAVATGSWDTLIKIFA